MVTQIGPLATICCEPRQAWKGAAAAAASGAEVWLVWVTAIDKQAARYGAVQACEASSGEVSEWSKEHAWKVCKG